MNLYSYKSLSLIGLMLAFSGFSQAMELAIPAQIAGNNISTGNHISGMGFINTFVISAGKNLDKDLVAAGAGIAGICLGYAGFKKLITGEGSSASYRSSMWSLFGENRIYAEIKQLPPNPQQPVEGAQVKELATQKVKFVLSLPKPPKVNARHERYKGLALIAGGAGFGTLSWYLMNHK